MTNKHQKGFTLIEVIIYIALFSILIGSAFVTAYQLIDGSGKLSQKSTIQEEGNFVLRKLNWALTGILSIATPSTGSPNSNTLSVTKHNGDTINFRLAGNKIEIKENTSTYLPITTDNVKVSALNFEFIPEIGSGPEGIRTTFKINDADFSITKYIRK